MIYSHCTSCGPISQTVGKPAALYLIAYNLAVPVPVTVPSAWVIAVAFDHYNRSSAFGFCTTIKMYSLSAIPRPV